MVPHNECEVKILAQDQSREFQDVNIFKRNFKVIQSDPFSKGFTVIKDVEKYDHRQEDTEPNSTLIPNRMEILI